MAKANVILLNSILWNLREVTKLAENIKSHCGDVDCTSWRYPLTSCSELEIFKLLQSNRNLDSYTYILELTYDRLLYVFNLIIKFLESTDSLENFRPSKNVQRPKTLSLASVLYMIWDRIKAQVEIAKSKAVTEKKEVTCAEAETEVKESPKSSVSTQSEICSIAVCSCCEMVQEFITRLVLEMESILEKHDTPSALSEERHNMREFLGEMTNWSAMSKWLTAISKDIKNLSEKAEEATTYSRKLKRKVENGEQKTKFKIEQCEEENRKLNTRCRDFEHHKHNLEERIKQYAKEKDQMNEVIRAKNVEVQNFEKKIEDMRKCYESKLADMKTEIHLRELKKEEEWKFKIETEYTKKEEVETEKKKLTGIINGLRDEIGNLNFLLTDEKSVFSSRYNDLESEINNLKEEQNKLTSLLNEKQKLIDDYVKKFMDLFPDLNEGSIPKYKASGNPEIDMENQMEANKLRIELLQSENDRLGTTLEKLKSLKG